MAKEKTSFQPLSLFSIYSAKIRQNLELVKQIGVGREKHCVSLLEDEIKKIDFPWDQFSTLLRSLYQLKKIEPFSEGDGKQSQIIDLALNFILCHHPYKDASTQKEFNNLLNECEAIFPDPFLNELRTWHTEAINRLPILSDYLAKKNDYRDYIHQILDKSANPIDSMRLAQILILFANHRAALYTETTFLKIAINFFTANTYTLPESVSHFIQFLEKLTENYAFSLPLACQIKSQLLLQQIKDECIENEENISDFLAKLNVLYNQYSLPPLANSEGTADLCQHGAKLLTSLDPPMVSFLGHQLIEQITTQKGFAIDYAKAAITFFSIEKNTNALFTLLFTLAKSPEFMPILEEAFRVCVLPLATIAEYKILLQDIVKFCQKTEDETKFLAVTLPIFAERHLDPRESIAFLKLYETLRCKYTLPNVSDSLISLALTQQATELISLTAHLATFAISSEIHEFMQRLKSANLLIETSFFRDYQYLKHEYRALKAKLEKKQLQLAEKQKNLEKTPLYSILREEKLLKKLNHRWIFLQQKIRLFELNLAQFIEQIKTLNHQHYIELVNDCDVYHNHIFKLEALAEFETNLAQVFTQIESGYHPLNSILHEQSLTQAFEQTKDFIQTTRKNQLRWSEEQSKLLVELNQLKSDISGLKQCLSLRPQLVTLANKLHHLMQQIESANQTIEKNLVTTQQILIEKITPKEKALDASYLTQKLAHSSMQVEITEFTKKKSELNTLKASLEKTKTELEQKMIENEAERVNLGNSLNDVTQSINTLTSAQIEIKQRFKDELLIFSQQVIPILDAIINRDRYSIGYMWACFIVFLFGKTNFNFVKKNKKFLKNHKATIEKRNELFQINQEYQLNQTLPDVYQSTLKLKPLFAFFTTHPSFKQPIQIAEKINTLLQMLSSISINNADLIKKKFNQGDTQRRVATLPKTLDSLKGKLTPTIHDSSIVKQNLNAIEAVLKEKNQKSMEVKEKLNHLKIQRSTVKSILIQIRGANPISINDTNNNHASETPPLPLPTQIEASEAGSGKTNSLSNKPFSELSILDSDQAQFEQAPAFSSGNEDGSENCNTTSIQNRQLLKQPIEETLALFPNEAIQTVFKCVLENTEAMVKESFLNTMAMSKAAAAQKESPLYPALLNKNSFFYQPVTLESIPLILAMANPP